MSALNRLRMLSKALLPTYAHRILAARFYSASTQENPAETDVEDTEKSKEEIHYKLCEYQQLLESKVICKQQLRHMVYHLNRDRQRGARYPAHLTPEQMHELILLPSWRKKQRFLLYWYYKESRDWRRQNPRSPPVYDKPLLKPWTSTDELPRYALFQNALFLRMGNQAQYGILERAMVNFFPFALKVALDFAYDDLMTPREINKLGEDVGRMIAFNRTSGTPLNIHFCSFDPENSLSAKLIDNQIIKKRMLPFPYEVSAKPVVDMIPRERLVYLSPEGNEVLDKVDTDLVYVLGALVDKTNLTGASARRAEELGVRSMRFPGSFTLRHRERENEKPLHVPHCSQILANLARGCSWEEAVECMPKQFAAEFEV